MKLLTLAATMAAVVMINSAGRACDICKMPVMSCIQDEAKSTSLSLDFQYSKYNRPPSGGDEFKNSAFYLSASQKVGEKWSVQFGLPYIDRKLNDSTESGIGDAEVVGVYRIYYNQQEKQSLQIDIYGGIKMPTGDSDPLKGEQEAAESSHDESLARRDFAMTSRSPAKHGDDAHVEGEPADEEHSDHSEGHHLALGSGSWDPLFGVIIQARREVWSATMNLQYIDRTEGDFGFEYGDGFYARAGLFCDVTPGSGAPLSLGVLATGEWKTKDKEDGATMADSDSSSGYVGPAIMVAAGENATVTASVDFPVYNKDAGLEGSADIRFLAGLSVLF